jgi:mono/diheme cytochrome c family protein
MNYRSLARPALAIAALAAFAACTKTTVQPAATPAPAPAPAAGTTTTTTMAAPATAGMPAGVTMAMVATGDSIFHSRSCRNCHGMDAKGATNGPDLTSGHFTHIDGSYNSIVQIITTGVAKTDIKDPAHPNAMPPRGGGRPAPLTDAQIGEVAAYIYSLSHKM